MQRRLVGMFILAALAICAGCKMPQVQACIQAKVRPEMPTVGNSGPVHAMAIEADPCAEAAIALIDVDGLLLNQDMSGPLTMGENPVSLFTERLEAAANDPSVCGVVIRINSYGGSVTACDMMRHELLRFREKKRVPVAVSLMDVGTSGAYYLATAGDLVLAHPTTITGGVGVILNIYNLTDALQQQNITPLPVKSGSHIDMGTPIKEMEEEKRALLQAMADEFHERFKSAVTQSRAKINIQDETNFDGRVFTASEALKRGFVDQICYLDEAIEAVKRDAGMSSAVVKMFHRCHDRPFTMYAVTPNSPIQASLFPLSVPGYDRTKMPAFLYLWQPEPSMEKLGGR
jgi:protease IV